MENFEEKSNPNEEHDCHINSNKTEAKIARMDKFYQLQ